MNENEDKRAVYDCLFGRSRKRALTIGQIADATGLDAALVSRICGELWSEGLVFRSGSPKHVDENEIFYWRVL